MSRNGRIERGARCASARVLSMVLAVAFGFIATRAWANDAERLRLLEAQMRAVQEELRALQGKAPAVPDTTRPVQPEQPGQGDAARRALEESDALRERLRVLERRVDQQGIQARLADGLILEDPAQSWRLRLTGRALGDYRAFNPDVVAADTFSVRQARLGVNLSVLRDWSIYVEGEYSGTATNASVILANAYVDWQVVPALRLRAGQFKPLFGLEHTDRVPYFDFTERALPAALIQNALFDRGVSVLGSPAAGLYYGLSLTNGSGQNIDERQNNATETRQDGKDVTLRLALNLAQVRAWQDRIVQTGFSFKSGRQANSTANPFSAASLSTEGRGITFFTPQAFNASSGAAQVGEIDRRLLGFETILAFGPVKVQGEYIRARYAGERLVAPLGGFDRSISGHYVSATWLITGERYADAYRDSIVARIRPRNNFSVQGGGGGAVELGVRYSAIDASDFKPTHGDFTGKPGTTALVTGGATQADAVTVGLKWIPNAYVRYMLNWVRTRFDTGVVVDGQTYSAENAINVRAQFDFF